MAWDTIQATDDLTIELWRTGDAANEPLLKIRSKAMEQGNEPGVVVVYLDELRHLVMHWQTRRRTWRRLRRVGMVDRPHERR